MSWFWWQNKSCDAVRPSLLCEMWCVWTVVCLNCFVYVYLWHSFNDRKVGGCGKGCRCGKRLSIKSWGWRSLTHTRWSGGFWLIRQSKNCLVIVIVSHPDTSALFLSSSSSWCGRTVRDHDACLHIAFVRVHTHPWTTKTEHTVCNSGWWQSTPQL